jgi:uncharacterized membrane protein
MDLPVDPVHMPVEEILAVLRRGYRSAAASGSDAAVAYLQRTLEDTLDLPHAVQMVAYELLAEAQAESLDWDGCTASLARAQEERKLALLASKPAGRSAVTAFPLPSEPPAAAAPPLPVEAAPLPAPAPPPPGNDRPVQEKFCCSCGRNVTHRSRRKDPLTRTYLCSDCYASRNPQPGRRPPVTGRPVVWITLLSLLAALVLGILLLGGGP